MEVARLRRFWHAFADAVGAFLDETAFRLSLAIDVLARNLPLEADKRIWDRCTERPTLVDVYDWASGRLIFSVMVWPPLSRHSEATDAESSAKQEYFDRVRDVKAAVTKGAADNAWSTYFETDFGLTACVIMIEPACNTRTAGT